MITGVVFNALKGLVSNRCYPSTFPQEGMPTWPAIRYTLVDVITGTTICDDDLGETDDYRVQIDCVALTDGATQALRDAVFAAMQTVEPPARRDGWFMTYDPETKTHRAVITYLLQPSSPA